LSFSGWLIGKETIEKPWMAEYIDKKLNVDASATFDALGWKPTPRYHILRRLLFLTENMISHPNDWRYRNELLLQRVAYRKSTMIYDILTELRESMIEKIVAQVMRPENERRFSNYRKMYRELLNWNVTLNFQLIASAVRNRDRSMIPNYAKEIAFIRYSDGFKVGELKDLMMLTGKTMVAFLLERPELKGSKQRVDDYIILTSQLAADEFEDTYEMLEVRLPESVTSIEDNESLTSTENLKRIIRGLEGIRIDSQPNQLDSVVAFKPYGVSIKLTTPKD
jgi:hypothetical protein